MDAAQSEGIYRSFYVPYLSEKQKNELQTKIESSSNKGLSRGLGNGFGNIFQFLEKEFQNHLLHSLTTKKYQYLVDEKITNLSFISLT